MLDEISKMMAVLAVLSMGAESVVEIIKNMFPKYLNQQDDPVKEGRRKALLKLLALAAGTTIAYASKVQLEQLLTVVFKGGEIDFTKCLVLGLLSTGGSGFWNQGLSIVEEIKKQRKLLTQQIETAQQK